MEQKPIIDISKLVGIVEECYNKLHNSTEGVGQYELMRNVAPLFIGVIDTINHVGWELKDYSPIKMEDDDIDE